MARIGSGRRILSLLLASLAVASLITGCGEDGATAQQSALRECPDGPESFYFAAISVRGISCRAAGQFLRDQLDFSEAPGETRAQIRRSMPGSFTRAHFRCSYRPLDSGFGWRLSCNREGQEVSFEIRPVGPLRLLRRSVLAGVRKDFKPSNPPPRGFEQCFLSGLKVRLKFSGSREGGSEWAELNRLIQISQERGQLAAAGALNAMGAPVGDQCGGRQHVPELIAASKQLPAKGSNAD